MKRSTNTAPVSLSTSYLIGSPCIGISITTWQSFGTSAPAETRSKLMRKSEKEVVVARTPAARRLYRALRSVRFVVSVQKNCRGDREPQRGTSNARRYDRGM